MQQPRLKTRFGPTLARASSSPLTSLAAGVMLDMAIMKARLAVLPAGVPHSLFIGVTSRCDLACGHCKYSGLRGTGRRTDISERLLHRLLAEAAQVGIPRVVFFGGEPLLFHGLEKAVSAASRLCLFTELDTNGQSLGPLRAARLASAGLSAAMISLHSADPVRHDTLSGPGTFKRAREAVEAAIGAGLITYISSCVFSDTLTGGELPRLLKAARGTGAHGARFIAYSPPVGPSRLPALLAAGLTQASPDGYARTCSGPGAKAGCAAMRGEVLFVGLDGTVKTCPYAGKKLGTAAAGLKKFLGRPGARKRAFSCQKAS